MLSPSDSQEGREDHDYSRPDDAAEDSIDLFELPAARRRTNENTDHDYSATDDITANVNDMEVLEEETVAAELEPEQPIVIEISDAGEDAAEEEPNLINQPEVPVLASTSASNTNHVTPSPPKKRKRLSLCAAKSNTPKVKDATERDKNEEDDKEEEDDGLTCPICLDYWEMSGPHRLVSLKCGHLFGDSCIRRWLTESARQSGIKVCPQCKAKALQKDIRCLYAKRLRAIDRSEEHNLREQLEKEREHSSSLKAELAGLKMSYTMVSSKINILEADNERMKQILRTGGGGVGLIYDTDAKLKLRLKYYKLFMEKNIEISREPGCRVMIYAEKHSAMIVSQKSSQTLFPGYGMRLIDTPTFRPSNFVHTSARLLRDFSLSGDHNQVAVTSMEQRSKLFDLRTRQVAAVFMPSDKALWACALDRNERNNFLYLGAQHGSTYVYDVRYPETVVDEFKAEGDLSPVINIAPVPISKHFSGGGFLVCKLQSLWFYEYSIETGSAAPHRLSIDGPFISMNFDAVHDNTLLISTRSSQNYPQSRYILGKLEKIDELPVFNVKVSFFGSKTTPVMTRSAQIAVDGNTLIAGYIQDAKLLALFDARREQRLQSMPVQEVIYDTCPVYLPNATYLGALTETKCRIYKLTPTS